jgi:hypothetical protein
MFSFFKQMFARQEQSRGVTMYPPLVYSNKMEALYNEAAACTRGEENVVPEFLESIRSQIEKHSQIEESSSWFEYATTLARDATIAFQTRAVEVDKRIETMDTSDLSVFTSPSLNRLKAFEANIALWCFGSMDDKWAQFRDAVLEGDTDIIELGLRAGVDPSAKDNYAILSASERGHISVVDRLLQDERVDPTARYNFAILSASECGHISVVDRLLQDERVNPTVKDNISIRWASANGHLQVVERLLQDARVDPSAYYNHAIRLAAWNGHLQVVKRLLQEPRVTSTLSRFDVAVYKARVLLQG